MLSAGQTAKKEATRADRGLIPRVRSRFDSSVYGSANCCRTTRFGSIIARWFQTLPARRTRLASRNQSRFARRPARLVAPQVRRQKKKRLLHTGVQFPEQTAASVRASMLAPIACGLLDDFNSSMFSRCMDARRFSPGSGPSARRHDRPRTRASKEWRSRRTRALRSVLSPAWR